MQSWSSSFRFGGGFDHNHSRWSCRRWRCWRRALEPTEQVCCIFLSSYQQLTSEPSPASSSKALLSSPTITVTQTVTRSGSAAATSNIQNFVVASPQDIGTLASDCPDLTTFTTSNLNINEEFDVTCGVDYGNSGPAVGGGVVADIVGIVAYTADDCMEACAELNNFNNKWQYGVKCLGITWSSNLSSAWASLGANCWLKNGTAVNPQSSPSDISASVITG